MMGIESVETFAGCEGYLDSLIPKGRMTRSDFGLDRMHALLDELGNPHEAYPIVHIGGTAGKGSTATIAAGIFQTAGYKTGLHLSPHLEDIRERAQINGSLMAPDSFVRLVGVVKGAVERVELNYGYGKPTRFEALVAAAFQHFKDEAVDIAVVEVGLGGKLDGTNVVNSQVSVLTNIGLDHMEILGDSVEEIARDKVQIFKRDSDVVSGVTQPSVIDIVERRAKEMRCKLDLLGREIEYRIRDGAARSNRFDLRIGKTRYKDLELHLLGEHQTRNAALAVDASLKMAKHGFVIDEKDVREALKNIRVPGRFEVIGGNPVTILDCAHNPMKMEAFVQTLRQNYPNRKARIVLAAKKDKDVPGMLALLSGVVSKFYFTNFLVTTDFGKAMSFDPKEIKKLTTTQSEVIPDPIDAYNMAKSECEKDELICITGSLYLVGELRAELIR
jgi:dihydrofolate synthase/folylpolyglutamate synthase